MASAGEDPPLLTPAAANETAEQGGSLLDRLSHSNILAELALDKFGCWECNHPCDTITQCHHAVRVSWLVWVVEGSFGSWVVVL